jgi:hypothetical protein
MRFKTKIVALKVFQRIKLLKLFSENDSKYQIIRIISWFLNDNWKNSIWNFDILKAGGFNAQL